VRAGTLASGWKDTTGGPALMSIDDFREHVAILGQSGSGKTVLLRRLIEEAAIQGVSSLVIDCSGDLTFLASPWPERPESFTPEDDAKAARFFRDVDVVVWTPFQGSGNPYIPPRVPDLREIAGRGDADELDAALEMAVRTVPGNFGLTRKLADSERLALTYALRRIANGGVEPGLESLVRTLEAIVDDADSGDYTASFNKGAEKLLESFKNTMLAKPNLKRNGTGDIRVLLDPNAARPRVSVLNLTLGGPSPELLRETVQNVLTSIYAMATANHPRSMNGIIAIDEAKEFVPSRITVESKSIIIKLASMARKYGYGLVLASQSVTSLDTQAINNFSTKFVGKHSSGAAVTAAVRFLETDEQLRLSHLENGCFYVRGKSLHGQGAKAAKVRTSLCLSRHPDTAPPPEEILEIARKSAPAAEVRG
jgi:DNA helicase HerA-like ATPase